MTMLMTQGLPTCVSTHMLLALLGIFQPSHRISLIPTVVEYTCSYRTTLHVVIDTGHSTRLYARQIVPKACARLHGIMTRAQRRESPPTSDTGSSAPR
jgi:hypothetical protein